MSADRDGGIVMWLMGQSKPEAELAAAHDKEIHDLAWNTLGTVLATGKEGKASIGLNMPSASSLSFWCGRVRYWLWGFMIVLRSLVLWLRFV